MNFRLQHPLFDTLEQILPITITQEYLSFFDSPHRHVMQSSFYIESRSSWLRAQYHYLKCMSNIGINEPTSPYSRMEGYKRGYFFADTRLPWVPPSPNMKTPATALVYPGQVLLEGTNISEGRGTPRPFEIFGAPFINPSLLRQKLDKRKLPGCHFQEAFFTPQFDKWQGQQCHGLEIQVTDPRAYKPYYTTLAILQEVMKAWPDQFSWLAPPYEYEFKKLPIDIITGNETIRKGLEAGRDLDEMEGSWQEELKGFLVKRKQHLLY